jgi:hypothetical protein
MNERVKPGWQPAVVGPAFDLKSLWRAQSRPGMPIYASVGRQQQAGAMEYSGYFKKGKNRTSLWLPCCENDGHNPPEVFGIRVGDSVLLGLAEDSSRKSPPIKSSDRGILELVARLQKISDVDTALDLLYDEMDVFLKNQQFKLIDNSLGIIEAGSLSADLLIGILTTTLPAKTKLPSRRDFFSRVEATLKKRGEWEDGLLVGLEN